METLQLVSGNILKILASRKCCATSRNVAGSIPDGVIGIFHWRNPSDRTTALGVDSTSNKWVPGVFPGDKKRPVRKAENLTTILGYCHVIWET